MNDEGKRTAIEALPPARVLTGDGPEEIFRSFWMPELEPLRIHRAHLDMALKEARPS